MSKRFGKMSVPAAVIIEWRDYSCLQYRH